MNKQVRKLKTLKMAYAYLQRKAILIPSEKKSANSAALCNAKVTLNRIFLAKKKAKIDI